MILPHTTHTCAHTLTPTHTYTYIYTYIYIFKTQYLCHTCMCECVCMCVWIRTGSNTAPFLCFHFKDLHSHLINTNAISSFRVLNMRSRLLKLFFYATPLKAVSKNYFLFLVNVLRSIRRTYLSLNY